MSRIRASEGTPFPFEDDMVDRMLGWGRQRILDGPDPAHVPDVLRTLT